MISDPTYIPLQIFSILLLIALNGIVVLSNTALESLSRNKIKAMVSNEKNNSAQKLVNLLEKPSKYQYTNRILNNIIVITIVVIGIFALLGAEASTKTITNGAVALLIEIFVFFVILISLGELLPRKIALQNSETIALAFVGIQTFMCKLFFPMTWILLKFANLFLRIFKQEIDVDDDEFSEDEVMSMLEVGQESGVLKEEGKKMINSIFQFDDELAYEIMTPRTDVFLIDINDPAETYVEELMELRYSRIPVYDDDIDNIIGVFHIKDYLIKARENGFDNVDIRSILRKPYFVPETKNIDSLFFELQKSKQHIAILIDEYGGFNGIVTMEDIIEEVMGDINDEYDQAAHIIEKLDENIYLIDGNVALDDLDEELNMNLESDNSETIGGYLIDILGEIPQENDTSRTLKVENYVFEITSIKEKRIEKVKLFILPKTKNED